MRVFQLLNLVWIFVLMACSESVPNLIVAQLNPIDFQKQLVQADSSVLLLDVRTPEEFEGGHIQNAINLDYNHSNFESQISKLDKSKKVFVYCLSGGRSSSAVSILEKKGFTNIVELEGGMMAWRNERFEEVVGKTKTSISEIQTSHDFSGGNLILIDFYANWCQPCKKMIPILKEIEKENKELKIVRVNADKQSAEIKKFNVNALPTLVILKDKNERWRKEGMIQKEELQAIIEQYK